MFNTKVPTPLTMMWCRRQNAEELNELAGLQLWVGACFELHRVAETLPLPDAIQRAWRLDAADLFTNVQPDDFPRNMTRGAVAGVAAIALSFGTTREADERWAQDVILRASRTPEPSDPIFFAGAIVPDHPCAFAARGLRAMVVSGKGGHGCREQLLALATHPLEEVSATALGEAMSCWDTDPKLAWAAFDLGLRLSIGRWDQRISPHGYDHTSNRKLIQAALRAALKKMRAGRSDVALTALPAAWVNDTGAKRGWGPQAAKPRPSRAWLGAPPTNSYVGTSCRKYFAVRQSKNFLPIHNADRRSWRCATIS